MYQTRNFYCNYVLFRLVNIVRYWIWWNDLIQGPFELDELTTLKAFSEDLLVCMEDREDWLPAGRVADLSSAIEQLRARRAAPLVPPPPPPKHPPALTPLQGEFFGEPSEQQSLLESEDGPKGPFAYRPVPSEPGISPYLAGQATMPFHFAQQPQGMTSVIEIPRPQPQPQPKPSRITFAAPPVIKESPVRVPIPIPEEEPIPQEKIEEKPKAVIPIELLQERPSMAPPMEEPAAAIQKPNWLPWIAGVVLAMGMLGSVGYWLLDKVSTHSAIAEANRLNPLNPLTIAVGTPLPMAKPVAPPPVTTKIYPYVTAPARVVRSSVAKSKNMVQKVKSSLNHKLHKKSSSFPAATGRESIAKKMPPSGPPTMALGGDKLSKSVMPGVTQETPVVKAPAPAPAPAQTPTLSPIPTPTPAVSAPDPWRGKQTDAINLVMNQTLPKSKITIGNQARALLQQMHEKELLHAAETGERLYLPDKLAWAALQEEGSHYRVYLNFLSWQANGERLQSRSYQFLVDLSRKDVRSDDAATQQDILTQPAELTFKHNPMATDIDSILGGVDTYNKHKVQMIIVKKSSRNKEQRKKIEAAMTLAQDKVKRAVVYFRRTYSEKALQNIAKAYDFADLLKG